MAASVNIIDFIITITKHCNTVHKQGSIITDLFQYATQKKVVVVVYSYYYTKTYRLTQQSVKNDV